MLVPVQSSGTKPPLFFVHGLHGVMPMGRVFSQALGGDQPLYAIHANGIDGRSSVIDSMKGMVEAYVDEIQRARPGGPIVVGGMSDGGLAAVEIARALRETGRELRPVILADPPAVPRIFNEQNPFNDPARPQFVQQLQQRVRKRLLALASRAYNDLPFDASDPDQLHLASSAGLGSFIAFSRHVPRPYSAPAQLIVSHQRAPIFFHPEMPWHKLLMGPRMVHVLPWHQMFRSDRESVARALKFLINHPSPLESPLARPIGKEVAAAKAVPPSVSQALYRQLYELGVN